MKMPNGRRWWYLCGEDKNAIHFCDGEAMIKKIQQTFYLYTFYLYYKWSNILDSQENIFVILEVKGILLSKLSIIINALP